MALDNAATLVVDSGNFLTGATGAEFPTDPKAPGAPWTVIGHTSLEDIIAFESEGGESTILGTLQNKQLRTSRTATTDSFTINVQQFDEASLKLYYGSNATKNQETGLLHVPSTPVPTIASFLAVFIDKDNVFSIYVPKAEIFRADNLELSDTESLASLPLKITPLQHNDNDWNYAVTPLGAGA